MTRQLNTALAVFVGFVFTFTPDSATALDPAPRCESGQLKIVGKYAACRLSAKSKAVKKGAPAVYTRCTDKFFEKWGKTEDKAAGACPTLSDDASMEIGASLYTGEVATLLSGGSLSASCGNGTVDAGEDCDFGNLDGGTCTTQGLFGDGLACAPGCLFDTSGCSATRYEDTGLGTVIDHITGFEWEKKTAGNVDTKYDWEGAFQYVHGVSSTSGTGPFSAVQGLGGHTDWRLPDHTELLTILVCSSSFPCIDPVFGPTANWGYWSASTDVDPDRAWAVDFYSLIIGTGLKDFGGSVRAVRGGS
jgi:hypothetical protein